MNTTIQVKTETLEKLKRIKESRNLLSYDELINILINEAANLPQSMFGIDKNKIKKFMDSDRFEFREF